MLIELAIRDIALFPRVRLRFGPGLNVFSGETGAGKSLLVGSLRLLCGERPPQGLVRTGSERGVVEGIFELSREGSIASELGALGLELPDGEFILRREIATSGKGRILANGNAIPRATLVAAAEHLIDLHGQHDHQSLLKPAFQRDALDEFADAWGLREAFREALRDWKESAAELEHLESASLEEQERRELARFQLRELDEFEPRPGELASLKVERDRLEKAEFLRSTSAKLVQVLSEQESSVRDTLAELEGDAADARGHDPAWAPFAEQLRELTIGVEELAREARELGERAVDEPERLVVVRERLRLLEDLLRKYGPGEEELFAFWRRLSERGTDSRTHEERLSALRTRVEEISDRLARLGSQLSRNRRAAARALRRAVEDSLAELGMENVRFESQVSPLRQGIAFQGEEGARAGTAGLDQVEFFLAPNRGEEIRKLSVAASGGEISRVMLALKSVLAATRGTATMVFDEIDIGVGGAIARRVADMLATIGTSRQVFCITHLAAIASRASSHYRVHKETRDERTVSLVEELHGESRVREIARMLGSEDKEGIAVDHARELLKGASS